jgi:hypothetical protein
MKKVLKILLILLLTLFISIQFIRPEKNKSGGINTNHISTKYPVPDNIQTIFKVACYDCHSNNTEYPWYAEIQPIAWWLNDHIVYGKKGLNFSEFSTYRIHKQYRKLEEINELVKDNSMPLPSYTRLHRNALLNDDQKMAIAKWTSALRDSIEAHHPADSLVRK